MCYMGQIQLFTIRFFGFDMFACVIPEKMIQLDNEAAYMYININQILISIGDQLSQRETLCGVVTSIVFINVYSSFNIV